MPNEPVAPVAQPEASPAPTPSAPANNPAKQNESETALKASDIAAMKPDQLDAMSSYISDVIPRDPKTGKAVLPPQKPAAEATPAPAEPAPADAPAPAETVTEPVPGEPSPEPEPGTPEPEPEPTVDGKPPQRRIRGETPEDDAAMALYTAAQRKGKPISMAEAALEAGRILNPETKPADTLAPKSVDAANAELAALQQERKDAVLSFDHDKEFELTEKIEAKREEIRDIREDARARQQAAEHQARTVFQHSMERAKDLYPDLITKGSAIEIAKNEIHEELRAANDPAINTPDYPLYLAQLAAKRTLTPPKSAKSPTTSKPVPTRSVQPAKPVAPLASASARTTQPGQGQAVKALVATMSQADLDRVQNDLANLVRPI